MMTEPTFEIITFEEWRQNIVPLWPWNEDYRWIPIIHNPLGIMRYTGREIFEKVVQFPVVCKVDGEPAGYCCFYNISDTHIRTRGVYVDPKYRGRGLVKPMLEYGCSLFADNWNTFILIAREDNIDYWLKTWFDRKCEGYDWLPRMVNGEEQDIKITMLEKKFR